MSFSMKTLLSAGAADLVEKTGKAIDDNVTSDEERLTLRNDVTRMITDYNTKQLEMFGVVTQAVSDRWSADMQSDNKLSKTVRPAILIVVTAMTFILALVSVFATLDENQVRALEAWSNVFMGMNVTVYGAYFGGRSYEKSQRVKQFFSMNRESGDAFTDAIRKALQQDKEFMNATK